MITDKVLIIAPYTYQINSGGPSGFIAHNLLDKPHDCFELSHELFEKIQNNHTLLDRLKIKPKKILSSLLKKRDYFQDKYYFHAINAHLYKNLYFHDVKSFYQFQDFISPRQTIILQSHSPELPSEEYRSYKPNDPSGYLLWKQAEEAAFKRADIIIFPHPGCIPLYENLLCKEHDIRFILSGAKSIYNESPINTEIIKSDKINLMYIGRRNAIKGFDIVLNAYRHARENRDDLNLIIVGNGEKIQEDGIVDVGFSDNPLGWYQSVDYLINANRQSYFDLSIIEAISTGVPILMSDNYGHSYYTNRSPLIQTFDVRNPYGLYDLLMGPLQKRNQEQQDNILLYRKELSDLHYYKRFQNFVKTLQ